MYKNSLWIALATLLASATGIGAWELDYGKALQKSRQDGKPVLVVIGRGKAGWQELSAQGWSEANIEIVRNYFHAVYVDAEDAEYGEALAQQFHFRSLPALVISDRYARTQLVRQEGQLSEDQLSRLLRQHGQMPNTVRASVPGGATPTPSSSLVPSRAPAVLCPT
ncbi:MAG: thioredoxin family protein [Gemmatales bacterium]|nr:thioredoxin family protein [Gemmatales bacterium]MDW8221513.1 hypothetical protein [Gemmatales bacterium]